ncbi:hypothetical protein OKA05_22950 [Luteolibacter arcticus]|uniref:Lipoprotein n=1 Tax=Luteolibacter arcticus TaxID=1581411 RepID=A0ABT3GPI6_9BACT|nr:hypothetical protein [Luteolibacter arcticus]MCW1925438.1 hypothetical protein [Luteolibacter arcticus]
MTLPFPNNRLMRALLLVAVLPAILGSCARNVVVLNVSSKGSHYKVKEVLVTGRPIISKSDFYPWLRIENFNKPNGEPYYINSPIADEELERKLDLGKTYRFRLYITHQTGGYTDYHHAMLSKVEDGGASVIDASVCDVHGRRMEFGPADQADWILQSSKEQRDLGVYYNHGYDFPSCCSGGMIRWDVWQCPECRRKVDAFKSKTTSY